MWSQNDYKHFTQVIWEWQKTERKDSGELVCGKIALHTESHSVWSI